MTHAKQLCEADESPNAARKSFAWHKPERGILLHHSKICVYKYKLWHGLLGKMIVQKNPIKFMAQKLYFC